ncbi:YcaO-like family protein [Candidatus Kaiserbacteria bacterium]|nr:YcaO-like family protein [Candidatus Kaiserbacteria bacterium]
MLREQFQRTSRRRTHTNRIVRTRAEALAELRRPCGRFKSIIPTEETLRSFIAEKAADIDNLGNPFFVSDGTPLNWQRLLAFLHENNVIDAPRFSARHYRNDYPHFFDFFELTPMKSRSLSDGREVFYNGFGGSLDPEEAMSKAVGEVLERYFLSTYKLDTLRAASYAELSKRERVIDIHQFDFFLDWQKKRFSTLAFDDESVLRWVQGRELQSGVPVYLPAQIVYWNYLRTPPDLPPEKMIFMQTTSGSAGHFTKDEATLGALLEAIQREGFLIYWLNNLSPNIIDIETVEDRTLRDFVDCIRRFDFEIYFLNTTTDLAVPSVTCAIVDYNDPDGPVIGIGSSAGFDLKGILMQSAIEALSVTQFVSYDKRYVLPEDYVPFVSTDLARMERLHAWKGPEMEKQFRFFISGKKQSAQAFIGDAGSCSTVDSRLAHIVNLFASLGKGYEIYTYEVKNSILKALGYHVVRAIVPRLVPLYLVEFAAPLKARRLREVPEKIGYKAAEKFNPWPHPFP